MRRGERRRRTGPVCQQHGKEVLGVFPFSFSFSFSFPLRRSSGKREEKKVLSFCDLSFSAGAACSSTPLLSFLLTLFFFFAFHSFSLLSQGKKRGMSLEEKRQILLAIFTETEDVFQLKVFSSLLLLSSKETKTERLTREKNSFFNFLFLSSISLGT